MQSETLSVCLSVCLSGCKVLFLVSDGTPNADAEWTVPEADATKDAGIEIFVVGVTRQVTISLLERIASQPIDAHLYFVEAFGRLQGIDQTLVNVSCGTKPLSAISTTTTTTTTTTSGTTTTTTTTTTTPSTTTLTLPGEFSFTMVVVVG